MKRVLVRMEADHDDTRIINLSRGRPPSAKSVLNQLRTRYGWTDEDIERWIP